MMLFIPKQGKKDTFCPPPKKKAHVLQSNPFIGNYYLIIVVFSHPHFNIYAFFCTKENTRSFNGRASHLNESYASDSCRLKALA